LLLQLVKEFRFGPLEPILDHNRAGVRSMSDLANMKAPKVPTVRGRPFVNGNPGRKPGSKNRATVVASALLDGEAEELVRKAVELAKAGNVVMLKFRTSAAA
jgi:hypothetical protein